MKKALFLYASFFFLYVSDAHGAVQLGAGTLKPYKEFSGKPPLKDPLRKKVIEKRDLVPLARRVAEIFRPDITALKKTLIENALQKLPPEKRPQQRHALAAYIDVDQILNLYTQTLLNYYTKEELKALSTFLADEAGRKALEKLPQILGAMHLSRQTHLEQTLNTFLQEQIFKPIKEGKPNLLAP